MVNIKKTYIVIIIAAILTMVMLCGKAAVDNNSVGPAPNSGDGIPDGSGFDRSDWPNEDSPTKEPAPNSGDGIPDGSGF